MTLSFPSGVKLADRASDHRTAARYSAVPRAPGPSPALPPQTHVHAACTVPFLRCVGLLCCELSDPDPLPLDAVAPRHTPNPVWFGHGDCSYGVLFIFGHIRDFLRNAGIEKSMIPEEHPDQKVGTTRPALWLPSPADAWIEQTEQIGGLCSGVWPQTSRPGINPGGGGSWVGSNSAV